MDRPFNAFVSVNTHHAFREAHLEAMTGIRDPHLHLFTTDLSRKRMKIVAKTDPDAGVVQTARFMHFSERMAAAASAFSQILILGAGFDTRPLWWPGLAGTAARIVEVDLPDVVEAKRAILAENRIAVPPNVVTIGASLADADLLHRLTAAGYNPDRPVAVFIEGVTFFLQPEVTARLIDPAGLRLVSGSRILFDFQSHAALEARNRREAKIGSRAVFKRFPFPDESAALATTLADLGYRDAAIDTLADLARARWPERDFTKIGNGHRVAEVTRR